jgi:small GTP-binding protein
MIREIYIYGPPYGISKSPTLLYAKKRDKRVIEGLVNMVDSFAKLVYDNEQPGSVKNLPLLGMNILYNFEDEFCILVVADQSNTEEDTEKVIIKIKHQLDRFRTAGKLNQYGIDSEFDTELEDVVSTILKVVFIGSGGVGKTTLRKLLFGEIPWIHHPTLSNEQYKDENDIISEYIGTKDSIVIWDVPGQIKLRKLWHLALEGTDVVVIVTDSTLPDTLEAGRIIRYCQEQQASAKLIGIANKQDLSSALLPSRVQQILDVPTYPMVAIDPDNRDAFRDIIRDALFGE